MYYKVSECTHFQYKTGCLSAKWNFFLVNGPNTAQPIELIGEIMLSSWKHHHLDWWAETTRGTMVLWCFLSEQEPECIVALKVFVSDIPS